MNSKKITVAIFGSSGVSIEGHEDRITRLEYLMNVGPFGHYDPRISSNILYGLLVFTVSLLLPLLGSFIYIRLIQPGVEKRLFLKAHKNVMQKVQDKIQQEQKFIASEQEYVDKKKEILDKERETLSQKKENEELAMELNENQLMEHMESFKSIAGRPLDQLQKAYELYNSNNRHIIRYGTNYSRLDYETAVMYAVKNDYMRIDKRSATISVLELTYRVNCLKSIYRLEHKMGFH